MSLDLIFGVDPAIFGDSELADLRTVLAYCASLTWNLDPAAPRPNAQDRTRADAAIARLRQLFETLLAKEDHAHGLVSSVQAAPEIDRVGELASMFFASMDTSSAALGWAMWMLAAQPAHQEDLRRQTQAAVAAGNAADVPALNAFLNEVLRMFPPVPLLSRIASQADRIGDIPVEPGDRVVVSVIGLHHDRRIWPNAQKFDPSRFPDGRLRPRSDLISCRSVPGRAPAAVCGWRSSNFPMRWPHSCTAHGSRPPIGFPWRSVGAQASGGAAATV